MAEAKKIAMEISRDQKLPYVNGYDHPHIMSGQGNNINDLSSIMI